MLTWTMNLKSRCKGRFHKSLGCSNIVTVMLPVSKLFGSLKQFLILGAVGEEKGSPAKIAVTNFSRANATCVINLETCFIGKLEGRFRRFVFS